ncbi:MAG TPA: hypothetical protein VK797_30975, partial [Tepidisphaeraceae bacterium]|nr:hypothetical protein [Tepidisphaeraceae bacterium]
CHLELVRHCPLLPASAGNKLLGESVPSQNGRFSTRPEVAGFGRPSTFGNCPKTFTFVQNVKSANRG